MTLVDSNILLDIATRDEDWAPWSLSALEEAALRGPLVINDVVYAEISVRYLDIADVDEFAARIGLEMHAMPRAGLFLAAKAFERYRRAGGTRTGVLPDFFIGAHAAIMEMPLLTRDARRYRSHFPTVGLISPSA